MLNEKVTIKLLSLNRQDILQDYGTSLTFKEDYIEYRLRARVQDKTEDGIVLEDEYIVDQLTALSRESISRICKYFIAKGGTWKIEIEGIGVEAIRLYYSGESDAHLMYGKLVEYKFGRNKK